MLLRLFLPSTSSLEIKQKPLGQELKEEKSQLLEILKEVTPSSSDYHKPLTFNQNLKDNLPYNVYSLSEKQYENLVIAISIMLQIVDELEKGLKPHTGKSLQEKDSTVFLYVEYGPINIPIPIHLEPYAQSFTAKDEKKQIIDKSIKPGEERARYILGCLVTSFIQCYEKVSCSPTFMRIFCEKLEGNCIDDRTRAAFRYASTGDFNIETFTNILQKAYVKYSEEKNEGFFWFLTKLMQHHWGEKFKPDTADTGYAKEYGSISREHYPLIKNGFFSLEMEEIDTDNGFLFAFKGIPPSMHHLKIELVHILLQYERNSLQTLKIHNEEERKAFNTLMLGKFNEKSFLYYLVMDCKEQKIAQQLVSNASVGLLANLTDIWKEPLYSRTIGALEDKSLSKAMTICNQYYEETGVENILLHLDEIINQLTIDEFIHFVKHSNINIGSKDQFGMILHKADKRYSPEEMIRFIFVTKALPKIFDEDSQKIYDEIIKESSIFYYLLTHQSLEMINPIVQMSPDILLGALLERFPNLKIDKGFIKHIMPSLKADHIVALLKMSDWYDDSITEFLSYSPIIKSCHMIELIKSITPIKNFFDHENICLLLPALFHKIK